LEFKDGISEMAKRFVTVFAVLLVSALFICFYVPTGDCSTKSVSVETVLQKLKEKQDFILIDVRNPNEFEKFRIPGSVNIPLFALKTKTFLKSKPLVLINEGHCYKQLREECAILSETGFTISILVGGLYQWRRKGGPLEGDVFAQRGLNEISPQTFFAGKGYENWMVIDVSKSGKREPDIDIKNVRGTHIPFANDSKEFISKLKSATKNHSEKEFASILICDEKGKNYEEIERQIQIAGIQNVLYLKGGLEGYKTFEQQQMSMARAKSEGGRKKSTKTNKNCATCP
jgi:rhodanese-related sulfurtransferase